LREQTTTKASNIFHSEDLFLKKRSPKLIKKNNYKCYQIQTQAEEEEFRSGFDEEARGFN